MHGSSATEGNSLKNGLIDFTAGSVGKYINISKNMYNIASLLTNISPTCDVKLLFPQYTILILQK